MTDQVPTIENAVVNNALCFIRSSKATLTEQNIAVVCQSFYSTEDINSAKNTLFQYANETVSTRKGPNKKKSDISDILNLMRKVDENSIRLPRFLCDGYASMPPAAGFEVLADQMINVSTEMASVKDEISQLSTNHANSVQTRELNEIKDELGDIKLLVRNISSASTRESINVDSSGSSQNRGSSYSGALLNNMQDSRSASRGSSRGFTSNRGYRGGSTETRNFSRGGHHTSRQIFNRGSTSNTSDRRQDAGTSENAVTSHDVGSSSNNDETSAPSSDLGTTAVLGATDDVQGEDYSDSTGHGPWIMASRRRQARDVIKGTKKFSGSLIAAREYRDIYIGRCNMSVTSEIIEEYTKNEMGIDIMSCVGISRETANVRAFRLSVYPEDYDKVLDASMWPENVHVRAFFKRAYKNFNNNGRRY